MKVAVVTVLFFHIESRYEYNIALYISLSVQIQVDLCVLGAAGHVIRIFQDMKVTSPEYLSGHSTFKFVL